MRKLNRFLAVLLMLLMVPLTYVFAQSKTVTGIVKDQSDNSPMVGVTVSVRNTNKTTATNNAGSFSISAQAGDIIDITYVGYTTYALKVGSASTYTVQLSSNNKQMEEVVISQGIKRSNNSLGYTPQSVKGEALAATNRDNFLGSLQGRVAGATITPTTGAPGASAQIILRGPTSLDGNNQPLFVVDGLPISNKTFNQKGLVSDGPNRDNDYANRAMDINPEDIESVTILTGPEAASLYGTEGANGVIIINTKRAKTGGAAKVTYGGAFTVSARPELPEVQQVYDQGFNGVLDNSTRSYFGPRYAPGTVFYDNNKSFFDNAFSQKHDVTVEGGNEKSSYRFSPSFARYNGTVPGTKLDRTSIRLATVSQLSNKLKLDVAMNYINTDNTKASRGANSYYLSILSWPSDDNMSQYLNADGTKRQINAGSTSEIDNPFWDVTKNINRDKTDRFLGNIALTYNVAKWINIVGRLGADYYSTDGNRLTHPGSLAGFSAGGIIENYTDKNKIINGSLIANLNKQTGDFTHRLSLGADFFNTRQDVISYRGNRFIVTDFNSINNVDPLTMRNLATINITRKYGYFGNYNIGYKNFLYLSGTGRMDHSSTLLPNDASFFYAGGGLSFILSELTKAAFPAMSFAKLKANIGTTGKDPRLPYLTSTNLNSQVTQGGGLAYGVTLGNPALKAEFTTTKEFGAEVRFFKDRLSLDFTYYDMLTKDQITAPRLSYGTGGILAYLNSGDISNKGINASLSIIPVQNKNVRWTTTFNYAHNRNKVVALPAGQKSFYVSDTWLVGSVRGESFLGTSLTSLASNDYLRNNAGQVIISPTTGLPVIDGTWRTIGDRAPDFTLGWVNSVSFNRFTVSSVFDMRKGGDVYNGTARFMYANGTSLASVKDREVPRVIQGVLQDGRENSATPTVNTITVNPYYNTNYYSATFADPEFLERDINWFRIVDFSVRYSINPKYFVKTKVIKGVDVGLSGANLLVLSNYTGIDPSVSGLTASVGGVGGSGIDFGVIPSVRTYTFNLIARF